MKSSNETNLRFWLTDNGGGWGLVASPVFKTGVTRPRRAWWVRFPHSPARLVLLALISACLFAAPSRLSAQRPDTTKTRVPSVIIRGAQRDSQAVDAPSVIKISPRKAFLTSLVAPGYMQFRFSRPKAAALFLSVEAATLAMTIKSRSDLNKAKAARLDSIFTPIVDNLGMPVIDSVTGKPKILSELRNKNIADRVAARRTHLEDWIAGLVFNHLFAGADAYVAANLADFNTNVRVTSTGRSVKVLASIAW